MYGYSGDGAHAGAEVDYAIVAASANSVTWGNVSSKPSFATVATTGSYNDLSDKPAGGGGGVSQGTAIAMAMVFG